MTNLHQSDETRKSADEETLAIQAAIREALAEVTADAGGTVQPLTEEQQQQRDAAAREYDCLQADFLIERASGQTELEFRDWLAVEVKTVAPPPRSSTRALSVRERRPRAGRRESGRRPARVVRGGGTAVRVDDDSGGDDPPQGDGDPPAPRRSRVTAAVAAVTITDQSCRPAAGLERRSWLRALVALGVPHAHVGRRTICRADDWAQAISRAAGVTTTPARPALTESQIIELASRRGAR